MKRLGCVTIAVCLWTASAHAYVDGSPTLGRVIHDSTHIVVLEVVKVSPEKRVIIYKKVADLKGQQPAEEVRHALSDGSHPREPKTVLALARPGSLAVCFHNGKVAQVCLGKYWYECHAQAPAPAAGAVQWWHMTYGRSELSLAYFGSAARLRSHLTEILAGKTAVITAIAHAANDYWAHGDVLNKRVLGGKDSPTWRIKASLNMPGMSYNIGRDPKQIVGFGMGGPEDVPGLVQALQNPDAGVRADAADQLGLIGRHAKTALPALLQALQAPGALVRINAAEALVRIDPAQEPAAVNALAAALQDQRNEVRRAAAEALGHIGPAAKSTVPALSAVVKDPDPEVRWAAVDALGQIGAAAKSAVPALTEALKDPAIRSIAIDALGGIGAEARAAAGPLTELLKDENVVVRRTAAMALARMGGPQAGAAVPIFIEMLRGRDARLRWDAMLQLSNLGRDAKAALPVLLELGKGDGVAAIIAAQIGGPDAAAVMPVVIQIMSGGEWDTSSALVSIGPAVVEPLVAATKDWGNWKAREWAAKTLADIITKDEKLIPALSGKLSTSATNTRYVIISTLNRLGPKAKSAIPALTDCLQDKDVWVRVLACWALIGIAGPEAKAAIPVLAAEIHHADVWVRRSSTQALGSLGAAAKELAPALTAKLKDGDAGVRVVAAWALVKMDGLDTKAAVPVLLPALKDSDSWTRQHGAIYLGQLGAAAKEALPALIPMEEDENEDVRKAAAEAVKQLKGK